MGDLIIILVYKIAQREEIIFLLHFLVLIIATISSLKVLAEAQKELLNYGNLGISVMGMLNYKNVVKICQQSVIT